MDTFADIIVKIHKLKENHPFTYRVPEGMKLAIGCRVSIPFGPRQLIGYCIALKHEIPQVKPQGIRDILAVLDEHPILTEELIQLAQWGANRYLCAAIDFLEAMVPSSLRSPSGSRAKTILIAQITQQGMSATTIGKKQELALTTLRTYGPTALTLLARIGVSSATIRSLAAKGWAEIKDEAVRRDPMKDVTVLLQDALALNTAQEKALQQVKLQTKPILLHGVTGSGKTEVYLQAIAGQIAAGLASIVLVPEIALTPQMTERFSARFGSRIAVLHSRLSAGERFDEWRRVATGEALVIIGARSAIFAPVKNLGLIILDEEHESTYKQDETPRYHAREIALWRARRHGAAVVLGSATPSLESYTAALRGEYTLSLLPARIAGRPLPPVDVVDMRLELKEGNKSIFSRVLASAISDTLTADKQAIIFLNRRGYATFVLCRECGHVMRCPACNISLKYHSTDAQLCCHYCDHHEAYPATCPECSGRYIRHFGTGTQKVEEELLQRFPRVRPIRLDADTTTRKGQHQKILNGFKNGQSNILVGTQMIAKGLDFPNVTLVGVITADTALNLPDFRAGERTFQMLTQVAGRAGRGAAGGRVVVQTYTPDHYAIVAAKDHDYETFYQAESQLRMELGYPPFGILIRLLVSGEDTGPIVDACSLLTSALGSKFEVLGPTPCPIEKVRGRFRWQLVVRGQTLDPILALVKVAAAEFTKSSLNGIVRLALDVEPQNLL